MVSVVTATYNRSAVLAETIATVRAQTLADWELIVVGDACTDDTAEVVASFGDARIRFENLAVNHGEQSAPNNHGVARARRRYVAFLNHDDLWLPDHLETAVGALGRGGADLVFTLAAVLTPAEQVELVTASPSGRYEPHMGVPASCWVARREFLVAAGPWRSYRQCWASPSQDWLHRAHRRGARLEAVPRLTALLIQSGGRAGSYAKPAGDLHRRHRELVLSPGGREELLTRAARRSAAERARPHGVREHVRRMSKDLVRRAAISAGVSPLALAVLRHGPRRGAFVDHLRARRGLPPEAMIEGSRDPQSITADWLPLVDLIDGVLVREVRNVPKDTGVLTEVYRRDWDLDGLDVDQAFQVTLLPGAVSAWHAHRETTDRLFVTRGLIRIVLYDAREASPTHGRVNELRFGEPRPALVVVPPDVWHGIQNVGGETAAVLNLVDRAYDYEDPDHWRLPADTDEIPYRF